MKAFRAFGCSVVDTSRLGGGFPDLAISKNGKTCMVEVKDGSLPASRRKLTPAEQKFADNWLGDYAVVGTLDDVEAVMVLTLKA